MRTIKEIKADLARERERRDRMRSQAEALHRDAEGQELTGGKAEKFEGLTTGIGKVDSTIESLEDEWREVVTTQMRPENMEPGYSESDTAMALGDRAGGTTASDSALRPEIRRARDDARRAVERSKSALSTEAGDHLERVIESDPTGAEARYLSAVANPHYFSAFGRILADGPSAHLKMSREEQDAMQAVNRVMAERAMSVGVDASGGFAVPFTLDPTVLLSSDGSVNPLRQIARVETIVASDEWRGVSSEGITVTRHPEAGEATDDSPTLAQPAVKPTRVQGFVPFSIEVGDDWTRLSQELQKLMADAKDQEEATSFLTGDGIAPNPEGFLTGLTAAEEVLSVTIGAFGSQDVYNLVEALPPRFRARASWIADLAILNDIDMFETTNGSKQFDLSGGQLLRKSIYEASEMEGAVAAGNTILAVGDFRNLLIVDRIGMQVEIVGHLFGANRRPTGQRGLYAIWRNASKVLAANAFRALVVRTA